MSEKKARRKDADRPAAARLAEVRRTLEYAMEVFSGACNCGSCAPCTTGQRRLTRAMKLVAGLTAEAEKTALGELRFDEAYETLRELLAGFHDITVGHASNDPSEFSDTPCPEYEPHPQVADSSDVIYAALHRLSHGPLRPVIRDVTVDGTTDDCEAMFLLAGRPVIIRSRDYGIDDDEYEEDDDDDGEGDDDRPYVRHSEAGPDDEDFGCDYGLRQ